MWKISDGSLVRTFGDHYEIIKSVQFSPDGQYILTAALDGFAKIWRVTDGALIQTFADPTSIGSTVGYTYARFSPDGKRVLAQTLHNSHMWDVATGKFIFSLAGHTSWVVRGEFSRDGKLIATASYDQTVRIWNATDGSLLKTFSGYKNVVHGTSFSPDGKFLVTVSKGDPAIVINLEDDSIYDSIAIDSSTGMYSAFFSSDGGAILTGSNKRTSNLWVPRR